MASIFVTSKQGSRAVCVSDRDLGRVRDYAYFSGEKRAKDYQSVKRDKDGRPLFEADYSRPLGSWHIVWKNGKIDSVATNIIIGQRPGTRGGCKKRQIKLHEFIVGEIPHCKDIKFKDGNPLNNTRENLVVYQLYKLEDLDYAKKSGKRADICIGCKDDNTCRKVPTRKRILSDTAGDRRDF
jgi:hypothetical protein